MSSQIPHDIRKEVASENLPQNINTINNNNNLDLLTSNPYATNSPKSASSSSAPNHYMPNSPNQIFFASSPLPLLGLDGKHKSRVRNGTEGNGENEEREKNEIEGNEEDGHGPYPGQVFNRRQTRLYRTLVWVQFSLTIFSCLFILAIMVLVAVILILLQDTINKADTAIRGNPVSKVYMKIKNAVDKINI